MGRMISLRWQAWVLLSFITLSAGCQATPTPEEAKKQFLQCAQESFKGDWQSMQAVFYACFQMREPLSGYEDILATAHERITDPLLLHFQGANNLYRWHLEDDRESASFEVYTGDEPPIILHARVVLWED